MVAQVSGLIAGVMFGLLSGQPLTMLGLTGPDLVFESLVITFLSCCVMTFKTTKWSLKVRGNPFFFTVKSKKVSFIRLILQVYQFCLGFGWEYLSFRIWIGLWLAAMLIILVATDARWTFFGWFSYSFLSLQLLCLLHHSLHGGMLRLPDRHHLHHQGSAEHDQDWLQLPHQPESLPLPSWQLHRAHVSVRRSWLDFIFPWQRLVECTSRLV